MKKFIFKNIIYIFLALVIHFFLGFFADGTTDDFYLRFTTPPQTSLILGSSRAAQGIQPNQINEILERKDLYNFSFTLNNSSFGNTYNSSILKKINKESKNGIFIISVEPWAFVVKKGTNEWSSEIDSMSRLKKMHLFNSKPNFEYLYHYLNKGWGNIILKKAENRVLNSQKDRLKTISGSWTYLHDDGWLEINTSVDSSFFNSKLKKTVALYDQTLRNSKFSKYRMYAFKNLIKKLKKFGDVYLVRLPVHPELLNLDENMMPNFDQLMTMISIKNNVKYINLIHNADKYIYTDGVHLYKTSGESVSKEIARRIKKNNFQ